MPIIFTQPAGISNPWDLSSATLAGSFNFSEDTNMRGMAFKPDGTKMYLSGSIGSRVYQYTLSSPWVVSSASYDGVGQSLLISGQDSSPFEISFSSDGTKLFMYGASSDAVYQYTLSSPWVVSSATYDSVSWGATGQDLDPSGMSFKSDGTKLYLAGNFSNSIYQYSLPTPWSLSTVNYDSLSKSVVGEDATPAVAEFSSDGLTMFLAGTGNDDVFQYDLGTAWNVSTAVYNSVSKSCEVGESSLWSVGFSADGTKMYMLGLSTNTVYQYSL